MTEGGVAGLDPAGAILGAIQVVQTASQAGGSGFQVLGAVASYPAELVKFLPEDTFLTREIIKCDADGVLWDNHCTVEMHGYFSDTNDDLICLPDVSDDIPANRYIKSLGFSEGIDSDTLTSGLLIVRLEAMDAAYGSPEDPYVPFWVSGRFDPVGVGDERYEFRLLVGTSGQVTADQIKTSSSLTITNEGDYIHVYLDQ
jgi:hypothetical protein